MGGPYDHGDSFTVICDLGHFCFSSVFAEWYSKCSPTPDIYFDSYSVNHHIDFYCYSDRPGDSDVNYYSDGNPGKYNQLQLHKHYDAAYYDNSDINIDSEYVDTNGDSFFDSNPHNAITDHDNVVCGR